MAGVEPEIAVSPAAKHRQIVRRHWSQASPHLGAMIVGAVGIKLLRDGSHEGKIAWSVTGVVAGEFRRRGDPQAIAEARDGNQIGLVDRSNGGWCGVIANRYG